MIKMLTFMMTMTWIQIIDNSMSQRQIISPLSQYCCMPHMPATVYQNFLTNHSFKHQQVAIFPTECNSDFFVCSFCGTLLNMTKSLVVGIPLKCKESV